MITMPTIFRMMAPTRRVDHEAALLVACAAIDAIAAGILLLATPLPLSLEGLAVAVSHGAAVVLLFRAARARPSRRWLCVGASLAVPLVGVAVATASLVTRGRGSTPVRRRGPTRRRPACTMAGIQRLVDALPLWDTLNSGDEEQRREALAALSRREDPEAIALLRRAAAGGDPDLALSAALVLDEIGERSERQRTRPDPGEVRHVAG